MYAVIRTGGKQYRVAEGDVVRIEKVPGEVGSEITFAEVLWLGGSESPKAGRPLVGGGEVGGDDRGPGSLSPGPPLPEGEGRLDPPEGPPAALHRSEGRLGRGLNRGLPGTEPWLTRRDRAARATGATRPDSGAG